MPNSRSQPTNVKRTTSPLPALNLSGVNASDLSWDDRLMEEIAMRDTKLRREYDGLTGPTRQAMLNAKYTQSAASTHSDQSAASATKKGWFHLEQL